MAYLLQGPRVTSVSNLDLLSFFQDAEARGLIKESWYLYAIQAGEEIRAGGTPFNSNSFSASVNGSSSGACAAPISTKPSSTSPSSTSSSRTSSSGTTSSTTFSSSTFSGGTFSTSASSSGTTGVQCVCSSGQQQCVGSSDLAQCDDGCTWTTHACATTCLADGYVDKSSGCATDPSTGVDTCWCPALITEDVMLFTWKNACITAIEPDVALYDTTTGVYWTTQVLKTYDEDLSQPISCTTGDKICWGAWWGTDYWGCGEGCAQTCATCCYTCGADLNLPVEDLDCD